MTPTDDRRGKLAYHARMFALAVLGAVMLVGTLMLAIYVLLSLGIWHIEDR